MAAFDVKTPAGMHMVTFPWNHTFPSKFRLIENIQRIHSAWYHLEGNRLTARTSIDVTQRMRQRKQGTSLDLRNANANIFGGDPAPRQTKNFTMIYKSLCEKWEVHESAGVSPHRGRIIHNVGKIYQAWYGPARHWFGHVRTIDVTGHVRKLKNAHTLDLRKIRLNNIAGDPAVGVAKVLTVWYHPKGKGGGKIAKAIARGGGMGGGAVIIAPAAAPPTVIVQPGAGRLPPGWEARLDPKTGRTFYINHNTQMTQWVAPAAPAVIVAPAGPPPGARGGGRGGGRRGGRGAGAAIAAGAAIGAAVAVAAHKHMQNGNRVHLHVKQTGKNLRIGINGRTISGDGGNGQWATWIVHRAGQTFRFQNAKNQGCWLKIDPKGHISGDGKGGRWCQMTIHNHGGHEMTICSAHNNGNIGFKGSMLKNAKNTGTGAHSRIVWRHA